MAVRELADTGASAVSAKYLSASQEETSVGDSAKVAFECLPTGERILALRSGVENRRDTVEGIKAAVRIGQRY